MNALLLYRLSHACLNIPVLPRLIDRLNTALTGCVVPATARIGYGTQLEYGGKGVHISTNAIIGNNVHIAPYVRIHGKAIIQDHAVIGAGCHLKGPVTVERYQEVQLSQLVTR